MDALDELNAKIEELCEIAERERTRLLDELISEAHLGVEYGPDSRAQIALLALDYATWTQRLEGFRLLLRGSRKPVARVK